MLLNDVESDNCRLITIDCKILLSQMNVEMLTCSLTASSHTSSSLLHTSVPFMIIFLADCIRPVTSSKRAAAIHPENQ